ncbi:MAG: DoxX family protein [Planctomycetes bacterium]|nr:DoxX family protein [Planctomycetota bacterium]
MTLRDRIFPPPVSARGSAALLALRLVAGAAFLFHGWHKIQHPFTWMGAKATMPGFLQALAALSEFGGGLALVAGLLVPLASLGLICTMAVAAWTHISRGDPFVGRGASFEPALLYLAVALVLFLVGPGRYSLDHAIFRRRG